MKYILLIITLLAFKINYSQATKDSIFKQNINALVEEMEFMYGYDQMLREYTFYKTFDKSETDSIEQLSDSLVTLEIEKRKFKSEKTSKLIWENYINPKDKEHTERMIEIIKTYGFPTSDRIKMYYKEPFNDAEFNPYILLVHAPKEYWEELKPLIKTELDEGRINICTYGHLLWHFTGRQSFQPMLDNGYELVEENGKTILKSTCK
ncbi:hypothetical protein [Joostella sp. CR20]|uniref:hypothetical protein n=1 Tax=Joostella sp. CR20 TaxID=2804312 RepID=UPI00313B19D8